MSACVFLFPGQGSQYVGMGKAFFDERASIRRMFEEASDLTGKDLARLCFEDSDGTLGRTDNVQPAITLVNLACLQVLREEGVEPSATAGHSLGEYAALCAAGVFSFADTIRLVQARGAAMKEAAERHPGGMIAIFGLDFETLTAVCDEARDAGSVEIANHNSPTQMAVTGEKNALQKAGDLAKKKGAKLVVPLKVSGAWHSRFMATAQASMRDALNRCDVGSPRIPVVANVTATVYPDDPHKFRETLVEQLVRPVLWTRSIAALTEQGHRLFVEAGPGKVLSGLMRDINREVKVASVQDTATLAKFQAARAGLTA
jgi:[acyl-carrier-protein] S-malonyltransferase